MGISALGTNVARFRPAKADQWTDQVLQRGDLDCLSEEILSGQSAFNFVVMCRLFTSDRSMRKTSLERLGNWKFVVVVEAFRLYPLSKTHLPFFSSSDSLIKNIVPSFDNSDEFPTLVMSFCAWSSRW